MAMTGPVARGGEHSGSGGGTEELRQRIDAANAEALKRINEGEPVLVGVAPAREVMPGLAERMVLHAGPPVSWERMCGAQRGAVVAMLLFEGWGRSPEHAWAMLEAGEIQLDANHEHQAVGPMAGTISPSLPVFVVEDQAHGTRAFARLVEPAQQFGAYDDEAVAGLRTWRDVWAPSFNQALQHSGGLHLKPLFASAIEMGDELHNRPHAATALFGVDLAGRMVRAGVPSAALTQTIDLCRLNPFTALALSMAAGKAVADSLCDLECSTVVRVMARNGTEFGIKVAGLANQWFVARAPKIDGVYLPGFGDADGGLDVGDSAITETVGWGGCVIGGAPAILSLVGGTPAQAAQWTREMATLTVGKSPIYRMPALGLEGAPTGFDIRKVVKTGVTPVMDTAIAHKEPGWRMIGGGIVRAPLACFEQALAAFEQQYGGS
jgi:hypothetical protein